MDLFKVEIIYEALEPGSVGRFVKKNMTVKQFMLFREKVFAVGLAVGDTDRPLTSGVIIAPHRIRGMYFEMYKKM